MGTNARSYLEGDDITFSFGLVWFYGISTIVGHLMPNPLYTYIKYMVSKHILKITFLNKPELVFVLLTV